ncbi:hypothetical protein PsorP6_001607 [Peronosclerospora sorghi]|uniref:Uncharacterized protein n=1 Tax=Peronosclerospora sorghi TaxID=230839 RepID=A0ACC0WUU9_9STRA|nr:hypothetical protein PsorP6_001607 [Peronosclerospora sorghi]
MGRNGSTPLGIEILVHPAGPLWISLWWRQCTQLGDGHHQPYRYVVLSHFLLPWPIPHSSIN